MVNSPINWPEIRTPAALMQTFQVTAPIETHWRLASCEEVDCEHYTLGWQTTVDTATELGQRQADYIRHDRTRAATEESGPNGMVTFTYRPGQRCFRRHRAPLGRPPLYLVRGGDWRGNPAGIETRRHTAAKFWFEDMSETVQKLVDLKQRG